MISQEAFDKVYDELEVRLNKIGEITIKEVWKSFKSYQYSYSYICQIFKDIMNTMIEQRKATKIHNGRYRIDIPNNLKLWSKMEPIERIEITLNCIQI